MRIFPLKEFCAKEGYNLFTTFITILFSKDLYDFIDVTGCDQELINAYKSFNTSIHQVTTAWGEESILIKTVSNSNRLKGVQYCLMTKALTRDAPDIWIKAKRLSKNDD